MKLPCKHRTRIRFSEKFFRQPFRVPARRALCECGPISSHCLYSLPRMGRRRKTIRVESREILDAAQPSAGKAGKVISTIGRLAGIKVNTDTRTNKVKYASAHDLRRAFGKRWAHRIMPTDLQTLMRHESIDTTLKYYVGQNAEGVADAVWKAVENLAGVNTFVNSGSSDASSSETKKAETLDG